MLSKKKMAKLSKDREGLIFTKLSHVYEIIQLHAELGFGSVEIYIDKKIAAKAYSSLDSKGFYCRDYEFECLPNEKKLYVSWDF